MGDLVAQGVGVTCEPEIVEHRITEEDRFVVVASDGVWEFLDNERVMKLVIPFWYCNRPDQACEKLVKEATAKWEIVRLHKGARACSYPVTVCILFRRTW